MKPVSTLLAPETSTPAVGFIDHHTVRIIGAVALPFDPPPELDPLEHERDRRFVRVRVEHERREQELAVARAPSQVAQEIHALHTLLHAADIVAPRTAARQVELVLDKSSGQDTVVLLGVTVPEEQPVPRRRREVLAEKR